MARAEQKHAAKIPTRHWPAASDAVRVFLQCQGDGQFTVRTDDNFYTGDCSLSPRASALIPFSFGHPPKNLRVSVEPAVAYTLIAYPSKKPNP